MLPSIKESDRYKGLFDRSKGAVGGLVITVIFAAVNAALYVLGYVYSVTLAWMIVGPYIAIRACFVKYKGNIVDVRACPDMACPNCETMGQMEYYRKHASARDEIERQHRVVGSYYAGYYSPLVYCRQCGHKDAAPQCRHNHNVLAAMDSAATARRDRGSRGRCVVGHNQKQETEQEKNKARDKKIQDLLFAGKFTKAERLVRSLMRKKKNKKNLELMQLLDQSLNGQNRLDAAEEVAEQIRQEWNLQKRSQWVAAGCPRPAPVHTRLVINGLEHQRVIAKQYYEPEKQDDGCMALYKILVFPKDTPPLQVRVGPKQY